MKDFVSALLLLCLPLAAPAHHSRAAYDMDTLQELEGELLDIVWRNPHVGFTVRVTNEGGEQDDWTIEGWGSLYTLERTGVSVEDFRVGDRVRLAGFVSIRVPQDLLGTHMLLANGTEAVLQANAEPLWVEEHIGGQDRWAPDDSQLQGTGAENLGIFRVWSPSGYAGVLNTTTFHMPFTESAVAARASWDPYDNYVTRCEAGGMPIVMLVPHPFRFENSGTEILLHGQVWDITRTIFMESSGQNAPLSVPNLGRSVGRWDGRTLIVDTTEIDWPYVDNRGTPQSEVVQVREEFALSENQSRLDYRMTITDPATFTEPATMETHWLALGEDFDPYGCQVY